MAVEKRLGLLVVGALLLLSGCATVADPRQATVGTFSEKKTQAYLDAQQAAVDEMNRQAEQLRLERRHLGEVQAQKRREQAVLQARMNAFDRQAAGLEASIRKTKVKAGKGQADRQALLGQVGEAKREMQACRARGGDQNQVEALQRELERLKRKQQALYREWGGGS